MDVNRHPVWRYRCNAIGNSIGIGIRIVATWRVAGQRVQRTLC